MRTYLRTIISWTFALACLLLVTGCEPNAPEMITISHPSLAPTITPAPIQVHMAGAVVTPGVYALERGSRIIDGIQAAGGLHPNADSDTVNLADFCQDGSRIYIPFRGTPSPPVPTPVSRSSSALQVDLGGAMNINTASAAQLETLPGIGPVLAERIIAYRETNGSFDTPAGILEVSGIGDAIFANIEARIVTE